jgi:hypothetical protein
MKITLEIPDAIFRCAKNVATERGIPLREFVIDAINDNLAANAKAESKPWIKHMGKLKRFRRKPHESVALLKGIPRGSIAKCGVDIEYQRP